MVVCQRWPGFSIGDRASVKPGGARHDLGQRQQWVLGVGRSQSRASNVHGFVGLSGEWSAKAKERQRREP